MVDKLLEHMWMYGGLFELDDLINKIKQGFLKGFDDFRLRQQRFHFDIDPSVF